MFGIIERTTPTTAANWKREYAGRYVSRNTGWIVERSENGGWNVVNPETGRVFDHFATLRSARTIYN